MMNDFDDCVVNSNTKDCLQLAAIDHL